MCLPSKQVLRPLCWQRTVSPAELQAAAEADAALHTDETPRIAGYDDGTNGTDGEAGGSSAALRVSLKLFACRHFPLMLHCRPQPGGKASLAMRLAWRPHYWGPRQPPLPYQ
jgi:hypothetical protein